MNKHDITLVIDRQRGCRIEYRMRLNGALLQGKVIQSRSKGKLTWRTVFRGRSIDHYNPEWLCRRNSRIVTLGMDHPSMYQVKALAEAKAEAEQAARDDRRVKREAAKQRKLAMAS